MAEICQLKLRWTLCIACLRYFKAGLCIAQSRGSVLTTDMAQPEGHLVASLTNLK